MCDRSHLVHKHNLQVGDEIRFRGQPRKITKIVNVGFLVDGVDDLLGVGCGCNKG